jgi:hypothetical protein
MMIAEDEQRREQLVACIAAEVQALWAQLDGMASGDALEAAVQEASRRLSAVMMQTLTQEAIQRREQGASPRCCGHAMDHHSRRTRTVVTLVGTLQVRRRYYRCLVCGASRFPADVWLGWRGDFSQRVEEALAWECSLVPYRQAIESLEKLAGISISLEAAERIVRRWGQATLPLAPYSEVQAADLVVQIDGTMAHLEEGWKEIKVGTCFSWDRADVAATPQAVSYVADWQTAADFAETLWTEALGRGAPTARAVAVIGDGAPWIWETASLLFPHAVEILDWYHLSEHLWEAAAVVHGEGQAETEALATMWQTEVWEGRSALVESHLRELVADHDDGDHTLRRCADYLRTHQRRLRYALFRAAGWPVGSGVVEGGCKHVVGVRFKRQSTRWSRVGAQAVLHLRLDRLNGRWQRRVHHLAHPLPKAA